MANKIKGQLSEEDIKKAKMREVALKTFETGLVDMAAAFYVEESKQYGDAGADAVDEYIYRAAVGKDKDSILKGLLGSRQGGRRYSGNVSEYGLIQNAAAIVKQSLDALNVSDVVKLIGSKSDAGEKYKEMAMADLAKADEEMYKALIGSYQSHLTDTKVAEALGKRDKARVSKLEEMLKGEE